MAEVILKKLESKYAEDFQLIRYAYEFAKERHGKQSRESGEPYIIHPLEVAGILSELGADASCISASLLHDIIEDTKVTYEELKRIFGQVIADLVLGVTKLSGLKYESKEETQANNYRKLFFATAQDIRVIFIKLADRLHNMRTLQSLSLERQIRISRETIEIYAPMAGRLGMANIKTELEDLCFKYLYPDEYDKLSKEVAKSRSARMGLILMMCNEIEVELNEQGIRGEVKGRPKHLYSIFRKMKMQNKTLEEIYDLYAIRLIVNSVIDCYTMLGIIHQKWKPIPGRFKDYIGTPKPNKYQSLHTTVATNFGQAFEFQVRTVEMNRIAEYGIAAHWVYKERGESISAGESDLALGWLREIIETDDALHDSGELISNFKTSALTHETYVFTPKGTVVNLPKGSTVVDFAYRVHTEIGNKCSGAKVHGRMVPITTVLKTGDIVEILTANKGPSRDWLNFVATPQAKSKIKAFFKKAMATENIKTGKDMLEAEAKRRGYPLSALWVQDTVSKLASRYGLSSADDIFATVGYGGLTTNQILIKLIDSYKKEQVLKNVQDPEKSAVLISQKNRRSSGILIDGNEGFLLKIAKCCSPVPGDAITGYATRGTGVTVHRTDCPNVANFESERIMSARWASSDNSVFASQFRIECYDRSGILNQVISAVSAHGYSISNVEARAVQKNQTAVITLGVWIKDLKDVEYLIKKISAVDGVYSIVRNST
ncbi:MAG: bifunctional (p)ppGpp synthetase/guanosine-3',5'-bis(diphosphate) 3'-pyrophosphohydrolase [Firmicutes bacterium]|nr:bifunctional (p)ppGpp synthetase/guanosine-3',5'-bis(diphosphate) 3'-pyrophosphohydrolase [Bacillota bacterium]